VLLESAEVRLNDRGFRLLDDFGRLGFSVKDREQHAGDDQCRNAGPQTRGEAGL
jgi:hypothetical protein